jgi:hypothetical protein
LACEGIILADCTIALGLVCAAEIVRGQFGGLDLAARIIGCEEGGDAVAVAVVGEVGIDRAGANPYKNDNDY